MSSFEQPASWNRHHTALLLRPLKEYLQPARCRLEIDHHCKLSDRTAFGNNEIGMAESNPRVFHFCHLLEPTDFVLIRPDDEVFSRWCAAGIKPSLLGPVMDLLRDDADSLRQIRNPPFVFLMQIVAKKLSHQPPFTCQFADS